MKFRCDYCHEWFNTINTCDGKCLCTECAPHDVDVEDED